jgi:hypothetical protein
MRYWAMAAAGVCLMAMNGNSGVTSALAAGASEAKAPIVLAQVEIKKKETVTEKVKRKVKRAWRNMTGYKFDVACPVLIPLSHKSCTQTGKNVEDARAKCQAANPLCSVVEIR